MNWKNWSDHPVVAGITGLAAVVTVVGFIFAGQNSQESGAININVDGSSSAANNSSSTDGSPEQSQIQPLSPGSAFSRIHTYAEKLTVSKDQCLDIVEDGFQRFGYKNISVVRQGIYSTSSTYNIFVNCNSDVDAVFLVVSGVDDEGAKDLREKVKQILPGK